MKVQLCVAAVAAMMMLGLKHHYAAARADDLWWILSPTTWLVEAITGATFTPTPGEGYFSRDRLFLIEKSCAGVNFMVAAFVMLVVMLRHQVGTGVSAARVIGVSMLGSYATAVLVNAVRIALAMWTAASPPGQSTFSPAEVHRIQGIAVYFGGLLLLHVFVQGTPAPMNHLLRRVTVPLAAYYAVTLGVPLANGAARSGAHFVDHALVVIVVPLLVLALACAVHKTVLALTGVVSHRYYDYDRTR
jgi:exosortase K